MERAVHVENVGKHYNIGAEEARYRTLRDSIVKAAKAPVLRLRHAGSSSGRVTGIWALRGISFDVLDGETVGIIGRNGAGKSTLLKILSRITKPTEGYAEIRGRVGSLLEVGTGFHPELTGRENISLNGAILGMTRAEINRKFDDIVDFAEIGRFLDTPVKRYSSGMYVRLAFAVAAHLEPEILVVDEVLSVGDLAFQRKCLGRMEKVAGEGRTVLFVSHNMQAVRSLCTRVIHLEGGTVIDDGDTDAVVAGYLESGVSKESSAEWPDGEGPGDDDARLTAVRVLDAQGRPAGVVNSGEPFIVRMEFDLFRLDDALCIGFDLTASDGTVVFRTYQTDSAPSDWPRLQVGRNSLECAVPPFLLNDGLYFVKPRVSLHCLRWIVNGDAGSVSLEVHRDPGQSPYTLLPRPGKFAPMLQWRGPE